jgi:hypothetical protein
MEMELHPISFNDHEPLLLMCAGKAESPIKGLGLLGISYGDARNDCMKDWLARWCGCHAMLFISYLQRTKASYYMSAERAVTVALVVHIRTRHMSKELPVE